VWSGHPRPRLRALEITTEPETDCFHFECPPTPNLHSASCLIWVQYIQETRICPSVFAGGGARATENSHFGTLSTVIFLIRLFFAFISLYNPTKLREH
jgi:hypothetical protein